MKTKALISFALTAKLICVFVFTYAKSSFLMMRLISCDSISLGFIKPVLCLMTRSDTNQHAHLKRPSMTELFVCWTMKLTTLVRSRVAAGLPTGYSVLGGSLTRYCYQQYRPRLDNRGGNDTHLGLCWKQVVPSIPGGDFRKLSTLNKRSLPFTN